MLSRSQVALLIQNGRQEVRNRTQLLAEIAEVEQRISHARSRGDFAQVSQLRQTELTTLEERCAQCHVKVNETLRQLRQQAKNLASECQSEMRDAWSAASAPPLPANEPTQLQDYDTYLTEVSAAVAGMTAALGRFRHQKLTGLCAELRAALVQLEAEGESLPAVSEYLEQGAFVDLPLARARQRLQQELATVRERLAAALAVRDRREKEVLLSRAREDVRRFQKTGELPTELAPLRLLAWAGGIADRQLYWSAAASLVVAQVLPVREMALRAYAELVTSWLTTEEPDELISLLPPAGEAAQKIDLWLKERPCRELTGEDELGALSPTRLRTLKASLPETSARLLLTADEVNAFDAAVLADWLAAPSDSSPEVLECFGQRLEETARWREAHVVWSALGDRSRGAQCLLAALYEDQPLVPVSADAWWAVVSPLPVFEDARVAAAATLYALRLGLSSRDPDYAERARQILTPVVVERAPALGALLQRAAAALPQTVLAAATENDRLVGRQEQLRAQLDEWLKAVRNPGGHAARCFYEYDLLPQLRKDYQTAGLAGLCALDEAYLDGVLADSQNAHFNPAARAHILTYLEELSRLAAELETIAARQPSQALRTEALLAQLEGERQGIPDGPVTLRQWLYATATRVATTPGEAPVVPCFYESGDVLPWLFRDNPLLDGQAQPSDELTLRAVTQAVVHESDWHAWRVQTALEQHDYDRAAAYAVIAPPEERESLAQRVDAARETHRGDLTARLVLLRDYLGTLEPEASVQAMQQALDDLAQTLSVSNLQVVATRLDELTRDVEGEERQQHERRQDAVRQLARQAQAAILRVASGDLESESLADLLAAAVHQVRGRTAQVERYAQALEQALAGDGIDPLLLTVAAALAASEPTAQSTPTSPTEPFDIEKFESLLVRREVGELRVVPPSAEMTSAGARSRLERCQLVAALYAERRANSGNWEEPLTSYLELRAAECYDIQDFTRAAEFRYAALQVAHCAAPRLLDGWAAARRNAFEFLQTRLQTQRAIYREDYGGASRPRNWLTLVRSLLLRGADEVATVLGQLLQASPTIGREVLLRPMAEFPMLGPTAAQALLARLGLLTAGELALLQLVASETWPGGELLLERVEAAVAQVRAYPALLREEGTLAELKALREALPSTDCPSALREPLIRVLESLDVTEQVISDPARCEVTVRAITDCIYLEALEGEDDIAAHGIPLYFHLNTSPPQALLRRVLVTFKTNHAWLELTGSDSTGQFQAVDLRIDGHEATEVACHVRLKSTVARGTDRVETELVVDIKVEVRREDGTLKSITVTRGKKIKIQVTGKYPYPKALNPFQPGTAVSQPDLIKGREEELQQILRALQGKYGENVPLVYGKRRIGKSTLLYLVRANPDVRERYLPVLCDMEKLAQKCRTTPSFLALLAETIAEGVEGELPDLVPVPPIATDPDPLAAFGRYLDGVAAACQPRKLLLLLDEMEFLLKRIEESSALPYTEGLHADIVQELRHSMQHKRRLCFLMSGTHELQEMTARVGQRLFQMPLGVHIQELKQRAAEALMEEPVRPVFTYSRVAKQRLFELTNGHPYFIQAICYQVFELVWGSRLPVCTGRELDLAIKQVLQTQGTTFNSQFGEIDASVVRRAVGRAIASLESDELVGTPIAIAGRIELLEGRVMPVEEVHQALQELTKQEILIEANGAYAYRAPLMAMYVRERMKLGRLVCAT